MIKVQTDAEYALINKEGGLVKKLQTFPSSDYELPPDQRLSFRQKIWVDQGMKGNFLIKFRSAEAEIKEGNSSFEELKQDGLEAQKALKEWLTKSPDPKYFWARINIVGDNVKDVLELREKCLVRLGVKVIKTSRFKSKLHNLWQAFVNFAFEPIGHRSSKRKVL